MLSIIVFFSFLGRIAPALLRQASYGTIKIGIYQSLKRLFVERLEGQYRFLIFFGGNTQGGLLKSRFVRKCSFSVRMGDSHCKDKVSLYWFGINPCRGDNVLEGSTLSLFFFLSKGKKGFWPSQGTWNKLVHKINLFSSTRGLPL